MKSYFLMKQALGLPVTSSSSLQRECEHEKTCMPPIAEIKSSGLLSQEYVQNINEFVFSYVNQGDYNFLFVTCHGKRSKTVFLGVQQKLHEALNGSRLLVLTLFYQLAFELALLVLIMHI